MKSLLKCFVITVCILMTTGLWGIPVHAIESNGEEVINGVCISLKVDSNQILLNGESKTLKNIPFLKNNIAYVPLREIVELCGGIVEYIPSSRSVIIALKKKVENGHAYFSEVWVDKAKILLKQDDGWKEINMSEDIYSVDKNYVPVVKNGHVFVPADYFRRFGYANVQWNPKHKRIILSAFGYELGAGGFQILKNFNLYDYNIKNRFIATGRIDYEYEGYKEEVYSDGDMELSLATYPPDITGMKGVLEIRKIVLLNSKYSTPRGLKVGDSVDKYIDLYNNDSLMNQFYIETKDGKVTKIIISATA